VVYMTNMFRNAKSFRGDLSSWDVSNVDGKPSDFNLNAGKFKEPKWNTGFDYLNYVILLSILIIIALLIWARRSKKPADYSAVGDQLKFESEFKKRLTAYLQDKDSNFLSKEELDQLLQINTLSFESQKTKRAQLIKRLNEHYPYLIRRIRNPDDKRVFIYEVSSR
jgi:surface protein